MARILVIGCSFNGGSYMATDDLTQWDDLDTFIGWFNFVEQFAQHDITVYCCGGAGYMAYAEMLHNLHTNDQLRGYDHVLIGETFEPRFSMLRANIPPMTYYVDHNGILARIIRVYPQQHFVLAHYDVDLEHLFADVYGLNPKKALPLIHDICTSSTREILPSICAEWTRNLLMDLGIPVTLFSWKDAVMRADGDHVVRLAEGVYQWLITMDEPGIIAGKQHPDRYEWGGHQTLKGNRILGQRITQLLGDRI